MKLFRYILALCWGATHAISGEPTTNEYGASYAYPYVLEQAKPVHALIQAGHRPSHVMYEISEAVVIDANPLLFDAQVDDRPHAYERCLFWAHIRMNDKDQWWLLAFFRWPFGPLLGHQQWQLSQISGVHSPSSFREYDAAPTNEQITDFLDWIGWNTTPKDKFRFITTRIFMANWKEAVGEIPTVEYKSAEQAGPAYPPQGVGSADP